MPDPIEELSNFDPRSPVNPMPAAEVRRRGDRLRRRNTALVVGGAVAAVVLVAVPVAVFAGGDNGGRTEPGPAEITSDVLLTADELPVRDRLTPWEETEAEGQVLACAPGEPAALDATASERRDFRADIADAPADETPASVVRTEVLQFADEATARSEYDQAQGWILGCPGGEDLARKGVSVTTLEIENGRGEWRQHDFYAPDICTDCDAVRFDRMGVAQFDDLVVLVSLAEVGGPLEPEGLDASMDELFQTAITKAGGEITGGSGEGGSIPQALDFQIENGLPAADGEETEQTGPAPDVEGVTLPEGYCGAAAWPPAAPVGRLAVKVAGPEFGLWRELVTFESTDEAVAVIADLRAAVEECPTVPDEESANDLTFVAHDVDSGYDDATFSYTYAEGLGGVVYQFVRVGHSVLATAQYGEWSPETTAAGAEELNGENTQLTPLMCEYTDDGC
ncbi:MAG TPA: hypothetical protein VFO49_18925 [Nocardioides sp.]|nr:hypothetical protein [Nocardioides sp.]